VYDVATGIGALYHVAADVVEIPAVVFAADYPLAGASVKAVDYAAGGVAFRYYEGAVPDVGGCGGGCSSGRSTVCGYADSDTLP